MPGAFRTVLCPVDFDEFADIAISRSAEIAAQNGAHLCVLHVSPLEPNSWDNGIAARLQKMAQDLLGGNFSHQFVLRNGGAATQILDAAAEMEADLIVIPTHTRKGLKRLILGSVAEQVIRRALVPVLTIPASDYSRP